MNNTFQSSEPAQGVTTESAKPTILPNKLLKKSEESAQPESVKEEPHSDDQTQKKMLPP